MTKTLPQGEGAFGIVPFILAIGTAVVFCLVWFPANVSVFSWRRYVLRSRDSNGAVVFSGVVFVLSIIAIAIALKKVPGLVGFVLGGVF